MLEKELTGESALSLWDSYYLLAVSNTGCQPSMKKKKKKKEKKKENNHCKLCTGQPYAFLGKGGRL